MLKHRSRLLLLLLIIMSVAIALIGCNNNRPLAPVAHTPSNSMNEARSYMDMSSPTPSLSSSQLSLPRKTEVIENGVTFNSTMICLGDEKISILNGLEVSMQTADRNYLSIGDMEILFSNEKVVSIILLKMNDDSFGNNKTTCGLAIEDSIDDMRGKYGQEDYSEIFNNYLDYTVFYYDYETHRMKVYFDNASIFKIELVDKSNDYEEKAYYVDETLSYVYLDGISGVRVWLGVTIDDADYNAQFSEYAIHNIEDMNITDSLGTSTIEYETDNNSIISITSTSPCVQTGRGLRVGDPITEIDKMYSGVLQGEADRIVVKFSRSTLIFYHDTVKIIKIQLMSD